MSDDNKKTEEELSLSERFPGMSEEFGGPGQRKVVDKEEPFEPPEDIPDSMTGIESRGKLLNHFTKEVMADFDETSKKDFNSGIPEGAMKVIRKFVEQKISDIGSVHELPSLNGKNEYETIKRYYLANRAPQELKDRYNSMRVSDAVEAEQILQYYLRG